MLQLNAYFGGNAPSKVYERDTVKKFRKAEHEVYLQVCRRINTFVLSLTR